jgi:hypothetical protein
MTDRLPPRTGVPRDATASIWLLQRSRNRETLVSRQEASDRLIRCCSYSRLDCLFDLFRELSYEDWLAVLGKHWSGCDNIGPSRLALRQLLPDRGPVAGMMTLQECAAWEALPERLTVYRGCGPVNMRGASWSLSQDVAAQFPFLNRYRQTEPLLVTATVRRDRVLAVKLGRQELEIVTFDARRVAVEPITLPPPERPPLTWSSSLTTLPS